MHTYFFIRLDTPVESPCLATAKYNVEQHLNALGYCKYRKIDVNLTNNPQHDQMGIWWDEKRDATIYHYFDGNFDLPHQYNELLNGLKILWQKNNWNTDDLQHIYDKIIEEGFTVSLPETKPIPSPDKQHKAALSAEMYTGYSDNYIRFFNKRRKWQRKIKILKGKELPDGFFWFFHNRQWLDNDNFQLSDWNNEVIFTFNIHKDEYSIDFKPLHSLDMAQNKLKSFEAGLTFEESQKLFGLPY